MDAPRFRSLVEKLLEKTLERDLTWVTDGDAFILYLNSGSIRLSSRIRDLGSQDFIISIYNKDGVVTDDFDDTEIEIRDAQGQLTYYPKMHELYNMVRRQSTGADVVLKSIMDELE